MFEVFVLLLLAVAVVNCSDPCSDGTVPEGGYYGPADKCTTEYYWCVNGISLTQNCHATVWNNDKGECDHSVDVAACSSDNIDMSEISDCKDADGNSVTTGGFTKPGDCKGGIYYECQNGVEVVKNCGAGTAFNPETGDCVHIIDVDDCDKTTTTVPGMTTTTIITPSVSVPDPCSDGTFADGDYYGPADKCTTEYYWCAKGISITKNCPGTVWNDDTGGCDHSYNVAACSSENIDMSEISDCKDADGNSVTISGFTKPGDCKGGIYYECQNGVEVEKNCGAGTAFNPDTGACGHITDVEDCDKTTTTVSGITPSDDPASPATPLPPIITTQSTTTAQPEPAAGTYVGFVVDDTGSMSNEIEAVKEWIVKCVEGKNSSCGNEPTGGWVITSFNDPYTGNVVGPTLDTSSIIREATTYYAHGGGDCPELGFEGLQNVVDVIPEVNSGCKIFFFTDATAKDTYSADTVTKLYRDKGCNFIPILTSCCGPCPSVCDTVDPEYYETHVTDRTDGDTTCSTRIARSVSGSVETLFYTMSEETGGNIYVTDKPSSPEEMLEFLEEEVTLGFCPTSDIAGPLPDGYKCQEDCTSKGMCWDKSVSKCFCDGTCNHAPISPGYSRCAGEQIVVCEANPATQIIPDLKNCTGYYQCVYGVPHHFNCAKGTVFSTTSASYCDHPENVPPPCGLAGVV